MKKQEKQKNDVKKEKKQHDIDSELKKSETAQNDTARNQCEILLEQIHITEYLSFQSVVIIGNAVGGVVFVALLKYQAFVYNID